MNSDKTCSFCGKVYTTSICLPCSEAFYPILSSLAQKQTNKQAPLENIDNLVFQGGGVKGVAYLGVLEAFGDDRLAKVKRIAGTSAGSMCALYLGLKKDKDQLKSLIQDTNFKDLLDEGEELRVHWVPRWALWGHTKYFMTKDVVLAALDFLEDKPEITKSLEKAKDKMAEMIKNIVFYLTGKLGSITRTIIEIILFFIKKWILSWFEKSFSHLIQNDQQQPDQLKTNHESLKEFFDETFDKEVKEQTGEKLKENTEEGEKAVVEANAVSDSHKTDPSELKDEKILSYAVAELLYTCILGGTTPKDKTTVGLFTADKIKEALIVEPIFQSLAAAKVNKYGAADITFKELADIKDAEGNPVFKPFYVCAFNTSTMRTDIFSVDHTPNVVIADAVRASMSIPIFFKCVTVREKLPGQATPTPRLAYSSPTDQGTPILYVDGGLLNNFPVWMFDDLRYCLDGQIPQYKPDRRIGIQNPRTLGFRIMPQERMGIYLKPYYDNEQEKLKAVNTTNKLVSYIDIIKLIFGVDFSEPEENEFVQRGQCPRSVYINDMKVSAVDFNLDLATKMKLEGSGFAAVGEYVDRAKNCFEGEIGEYPKST